MAKQWHYKDDSGEFGPVSSRALKALADSNALGRDDQIRAVDSNTWKTAGSVPGLFTGNAPEETNAVSLFTTVVQRSREHLRTLWNTISKLPGFSQLREVWERALEEETGEPYIEVDGGKELFRGFIYLTMPQSLTRAGKKGRVVLSGDTLIVIRKNTWSHEEFVVGRYEARQLYQCKNTEPLQVTNVGGLIYGVIQESRNHDKYGHFDGKAATNLQNWGKDPAIAHVEGIRLCFRVAEDEHDTHIFTFAASPETKPGSLRDSVFLLMKYVRTPTKEIEELRQAGRSDLREQQPQISEKLREIRQQREKNRAEIEELRQRLKTLQQKTATQQATESEPNTVELLKQLAQLRDAGVLTEEEFNQKKQQLLDRI